MADLVTLETKLSIAVERIVGILSAEDAVEATAFVGTFSRHVSKLLAITAFDGRI